MAKCNLFSASLYRSSLATAYYRRRPRRRIGDCQKTFEQHAFAQYGFSGLEDFSGERNTPPYAILSHRWLEREIQFSDIWQSTIESQNASPNCNVTKSSLQGRSWSKICSTCQLASAHGYSHVWIDTCCIDKTSSSELTEAINSMFMWYSKAAVCYVYLQDVGELPLEMDSRKDFEQSFLCSEWFDRGWTLQELLAPTSICFLNSAWATVGRWSRSEQPILDHPVFTSDDLRNLVSRRTAIPVSVLRGLTPLSDISIAIRMSWAARRVTTRTEDQAYCLLGIFDVNMPMLYGEGHTAFIRLQEEIVRRSTDQTIFAWRGPERQLLAPNPARFEESSAIVQSAGTNSDTAYELTNLGLKVSLILLRQFVPYGSARPNATDEHDNNNDESGNSSEPDFASRKDIMNSPEDRFRFYLVLNCHDRNLPAEFLALRVRLHLDPPTHVSLLDDHKLHQLRVTASLECMPPLGATRKEKLKFFKRGAHFPTVRQRQNLVILREANKYIDQDSLPIRVVYAERHPALRLRGGYPEDSWNVGSNYAEVKPPSDERHARVVLDLSDSEGAGIYVFVVIKKNRSQRQARTFLKEMMMASVLRRQTFMEPPTKEAHPRDWDVTLYTCDRNSKNPLDKIEHFMNENSRWSVPPRDRDTIDIRFRYKVSVHADQVPLAHVRDALQLTVSTDSHDSPAARLVGTLIIIGAIIIMPLVLLLAFLGGFCLLPFYGMDVLSDELDEYRAYRDRQRY